MDNKSEVGAGALEVEELSEYADVPRHYLEGDDMKVRGFVLCL